jgi:hypothetical protein
VSGGVRRGLADFACRAVQATLPPASQSWGWAVRCETAAIPDDTQALLFALNSARGLMPRAVASRLLHPSAALIGAVALGVVYMTIADAPTQYLGMNVAALLIGLAMLALLGRAGASGRTCGNRTIAAMAGALLATPLLGDQVDGIGRWVSLGGVSVQPSLILLPLMLVAFARERNRVSTMGILAAAAALAIQPDRAMAGMLVAGLAVLMLMRPDRLVISAFAASVGGFAVTLARADALPAAPYVDDVLCSAFGVHWAAGAAALAGSTLLLVPAITGWHRDLENRSTYAVFGAAWLAIIMAAALGNYPTPIVGYGGSAIIGYALCLLALPTPASDPAGATSGTLGAVKVQPTDQLLLIALA